MKRSWSAAVGVVAGVFTLGIATILASLMTAAGLAGGTPSPLVAVGDAFVDRTPPWLKDFAVATFGTSDKLALIVGMALVLTAVCAVIGIVGARRPTAGLVAFASFGAIGTLAVATRPHSGSFDLLPTVLGTVAGLWALSVLWQRGAAGASGSDVDRRHFLLGGAGFTVAGVTAATLGQSLGQGSGQAAVSRSAVRLPKAVKPVTIPAGAQLDVTGITPYVMPNADFYRIDTALVVPRLDTAGWSLKVHGLVDREVTINWATLLTKPMQDSLVTLMCVSNEVGGDLTGNAVWTGWPVRELLAMAGPRAGADMVLSTSSDGWTAGTPLSVLTDDRNALLAIAMNGQPLPFEHGFPVRLVVPGLYGYVSATKWVTDLLVTTFAGDQGYWTPRGWSERGPVKTESRIDVPRAGDRVSAGTVAVAGIAWAQHRGIRAVEVRVDDGPWQPARLAEEPTIDSWRQWVLPWQAVKGNHTITVRATDAEGVVQTEAQAPPAPDGATGWHTVTVNVG
ncbi:MAG TPA: molybdopterin-dependent oxidoreductase [Dermatophilaceae bacterium]|jgi:DMSO/TMAO reductase YedYZ molybdopterin-dependent catalytic subunit